MIIYKNIRKREVITIEGGVRKVRSDKKFRVAPSIDSDTHDKLMLLALACDRMTKTKLAEEIIKLILNDGRWVKHFQDTFGPKDNPYRITTIKVNTETVYKTRYEQVEK